MGQNGDWWVFLTLEIINGFFLYVDVGLTNYFSSFEQQFETEGECGRFPTGQMQHYLSSS